MGVRGVEVCLRGHSGTFVSAGKIPFPGTREQFFWRLVRKTEHPVLPRPLGGQVGQSSGSYTMRYGLQWRLLRDSAKGRQVRSSVDLSSATSGFSIRAIFSFLQRARREPVYVWIGYLAWSVFICGILSVFAIEYDLLP